MAMDYTAALKKVSARKTVDDNFMRIKFSYDNVIILPYKDGVALLECLQKAERLKEGYREKPTITGLDVDSFTANQVSHEDYRAYKIAMLLNCTLDEVKQYALAAEETA